MDTVILDGVEYIKASVAAKRFRYTSDYIGQLCRGKKIDARLVGRTWFVNPDSITAHKENKHQKQKSESKKYQVKASSTVSASHTDTPSKTKTHRVPVEAPLSSKVVKSLGIRNNTTTPTKHLTVQYERDEESLLPKVTKKSTVSHSVRVEPVDAKQVRVRIPAGKSKTTFTPSEIPSVALSGKVRVSALEEPEEVEEEVKGASAEVESEEMAEKVYHPVVKAVSSFKRTKSRTSEKKNTPQQSPKSAPVTASVAVSESKQSRDAVSTPVVRAPQRFSPQYIQQVRSTRPSFFFRFSPAFATVSAVVFVMLLFAASAQIISTDAESTSRVVFQIANLQTILMQ